MVKRSMKNFLRFMKSFGAFKMILGNEEVTPIYEELFRV